MSATNPEHLHNELPSHTGHDHHHHSEVSNRYMGHIQLLLGALFQSYSLIAAGVHNELDGPVHGLRGKAEHEIDPNKKLRFRIKAGCVMIAGATGVYLLEKLVPIDTTRLVTPIVFGGETIVNARNSVEHYRSRSKSQDTRLGLGHNLFDTAGSFTAFSLATAAFSTGSNNSYAEALIGYGHIGAMTALGVVSIIGALNSHR